RDFHVTGVQTCALPIYDHSGPDWSPDGRLLAFASARHEGRDTDLVSDVWTCAPDGTGLRRITRNDLVAYAPRFTPDGASVVFTEIGRASCRERVSVAVE